VANRILQYDGLTTHKSGHSVLESTGSSKNEDATTGPSTTKLETTKTVLAVDELVVLCVEKDRSGTAKSAPATEAFGIGLNPIWRLFKKPLSISHRWRVLVP
jgi:hypothetical protein